MGTGRTGLARYVVDAVVLEGRSAREVARAHGISKSWIYELIARYRDGGYQALQPRSKRPRSCKHGTRQETINAIVALRAQLHAEGHDCGAATIAYHLAQKMQDVPSRATIWRILKREGLIVPEPQKRPRQQPDPLRSRPTQRDMADRRHALASRRRRACGDPEHDRRPLPPVPGLRGLPHGQSPRCREHLPGGREPARPASVAPERQRRRVHRHTRKGKVLLQTELERLGIANKNSRPYHPADLREDRAPASDAEALPDPPPPSKNARRAANPARHVRPLLQQHSPAQSPRRTHTATGLQRTNQGQTSRRSTPRHPLPRPAKTRSTKAAQSRYATTADYTTSASAEHTRTARSSSSSPTKTSASSTQTPGSSSANSPSTPPATTNHSGKPDTSTMSRDIRPGCPETQHYARGGTRTHNPDGRSILSRLRLPISPRGHDHRPHLTV